MTIDEAIERLGQSKNWYESYNNALEQVEAHQLGIEALKWIKKFRRLGDFDTCDMLPGETENDG